MRVLTVVGARPNFMKAAPIIKEIALRDPPIEQMLVHTGQHYDEAMSQVFFTELGLPRPDVNLNVGSGSHAQQTALVMSRIEPILIDYGPDLVVVVGDVNSTLASALTTKKIGMRVAHVEAGLRSLDLTMPEEINRLCIDAISDVLFTTDRIANTNLIRENVPKSRIHFVGNVMIDSLLAHRVSAAGRRYCEKLNLSPGGYGVLTLHRPSNVDDSARFSEVLIALSEVAARLPIVFPVHPRTRKKVEEMGLAATSGAASSGVGMRLVEPLGYIDFLSLNIDARLVLTDSGGLQEETTVLGIPCVTLRDNTERPITISEGTNHLGGTRRETILAAVESALAAVPGQARIPEKWDGRAAARIADVISTMGVHKRNGTSK
jgi:UDP-N-acetylglucosamine 2-epimerase (non-hydrolysing)